MSESRRGGSPRGAGAGGSRGGGDPLARRAAAALRQEEHDERAMRAVVAAVRRQAAPRERSLRVGRFFTLSPLAALAAATLVFAVGLGAGALLLRPAASARVAAGVAAVGDGAAAGTAVADVGSTGQNVQFVLVAPGASRVALVGEFNGWDASATPMRSTGDRGTWSVSVPLAAGRHVYAFVVNDSTWMPDPQAPLSPERWYGERNSVVVVTGGPRT